MLLSRVGDPECQSMWVGETYSVWRGSGQKESGAREILNTVDTQFIKRTQEKQQRVILAYRQNFQRLCVCINVESQKAAKPPASGSEHGPD